MKKFIILFFAICLAMASTSCSKEQQASSGIVGSWTKFEYQNASRNFAYARFDFTKDGKYIKYNLNEEGVLDNNTFLLSKYAEWKVVEEKKYEIKNNVIYLDGVEKYQITNASKDLYILEDLRGWGATPFHRIKKYAIDNISIYNFLPHRDSHVGKTVLTEVEVYKDGKLESKTEITTDKQRKEYYPYEISGFLYTSNGTTDYALDIPYDVFRYYSFDLGEASFDGTTLSINKGLAKDYIKDFKYIDGILMTEFEEQGKTIRYYYN